MAQNNSFQTIGSIIAVASARNPFAKPESAPQLPRSTGWLWQCRCREGPPGK